MNTTAFAARAKQRLSTLGTACRQLPRQLFGNFSYRPPAWLARTIRRWQEIERAHKRLVGTSILALFLISCGGAWTWNWYQHLPKPRRVSAKVQPIEVTKLEKDLKFPRLVVYFSEPAARLEDLKKPAIQ